MPATIETATAAATGAPPPTPSSESAPEPPPAPPPTPAFLPQTNRPQLPATPPLAASPVPSHARTLRSVDHAPGNYSGDGGRGHARRAALSGEPEPIHVRELPRAPPAPSSLL